MCHENKNNVVSQLITEVTRTTVPPKYSRYNNFRNLHVFQPEWKLYRGLNFRYSHCWVKKPRSLCIPSYVCLHVLQLMPDFYIWKSSPGRLWHKGRVQKDCLQIQSFFTQIGWVDTTRDPSKNHIWLCKIASTPYPGTFLSLDKVYRKNLF